MKAIKLMIAAEVIVFVYAAIFLIWNEDNLSCSIDVAKMFETLLILCAIACTKTYCDVKE